MNRHPLYVISLVLVILGSINWLLVGLAGFDLFAALAGRRFGQLGGINGPLYTIVGLAGLYVAVATWVLPRPERRRRGDTRPLPHEENSSSR